MTDWKPVNTLTKLHTARLPHLLFATACSCALLLGSGCGLLNDSNLESQKQAHAELEDIAKKYTNLLASVGTDDKPTAVAGQIDQLVRQANAVDSPASQQKKIASAMAASMSAVAGSLRAQELEIMLRDQAMLREQIAEGAASAMIVAAGADGRSGADFSDADALIQQMRAGAKAQQEALQNELASMQAPHQRISEEHADASDKLSKLNIDTANLRQKANNAGPVDGYPFVEEAAGLKARSIPLKNAIAEAEIQLANLGPDIERTQQQRDLLSDLQQATDAAEERAKTLHDAVIAAGAEGKKRAAAFIADVQTHLATYRQMQSEIQPLFDAAIANLQKANRAEPMTAFNAARLTGDLWALRAHGAEASAALYDMLAATAPLTGNDASDWSKEASEAREAHTAAIEAARSSYESAMSKAGSSNNNQAARAALEKLISALDGSKIEQDSMAISSTAGRRTTGRTRPGRGPGRGAGGAGGGQDLTQYLGTAGHSTPQELANFFNSMNGQTPSPALAQKFIGACYAKAPEIIEQLRSSTSEQDAQAMRMIEMMSGGPGGKLKVGSVSGSTGDLEPQSGGNMPPGMPTLKLPIIKVNGEWFLDMDTMTKRMEDMLMDAMQNMDFDDMGGGRRGGGGGFGRN